MNEKIYNLAKELKELIDNDSRIKKLNELEKKINDDHDVMALAYQKDVAASEYSDILKIYSEDSKEAKEKRMKLVEAKTKLESHPLVKEYNKAYVDVKFMLLEINRILFKDYRGNC